MSIFFITFLIQDGTRSQSMINCIKEFGPWARITNSAWCIKVDNRTTAEVRDSLYLKFPLQTDERLFVVDITNSSWGSYYLPKDVSDWLKNK